MPQNLRRVSVLPLLRSHFLSDGGGESCDNFHCRKRCARGKRWKMRLHSVWTWAAMNGVA
jgi:hypothetical protein